MNEQEASVARCAEHPNIEAAAACKRCGKALCVDCTLGTPIGTFCSDACNRAELEEKKIPHHRYDASTIQVLEGIDHVRKRPSMYIGDRGAAGLHHLVYEVVDNSVDEAIEGYCKNIAVTLHVDGSASVLDDGRGIPTDLHQELQRPALEVIMTTLHSGGKFDHKTYRISGGLHGVGVSVTNALSEWLEVEVYRDGQIYFQSYEKGKPATELERRGKTLKRGTLVHFRPDPEIFETTELNFDVLAERLRELAFLNPGIRIRIADERAENRDSLFHYEGGIRAFVEHLNENKEPIHEDVISLTGENRESGVMLDVALQYNQGYSEMVLSFVNNINTREGGTHVSGFKAALTRALNNYAKNYNIVKGDKFPSGEDYREGLTAVVSLRVPDPQFEGQTKTRLGNRDVQGVVEVIVYETLSRCLEENPKVGQEIVRKGAEASRVREETRRARDLARRKGALFSGGLPGKLSDCSSGDRENTELYLVEGDSAAGTAKQGRDRRFQAILPLRGKILNVEKARVDKMLAHADISTIIKAIGTGIGAEEFDLEKRRYGRVIIMTDADVDGSHIRTLLLTFFFRHMPDLVEQGHLYIAQPPLYKLTRKKKEEYVHTESGRKEALLRMGMDRTILAVRSNGNRRELSGEEFGRVMRLVQQMEEHMGRLVKKGIDPLVFLRMREKGSGKLPIYRLVFQGADRFIYDDKEVSGYIQELSSKAGRELEMLREGEGGESSSRQTGSVGCFDLRFSREIEKTVAALAVEGFPLEALLGLEGAAAREDFFLRSDEGETPATSLREVLETVQKLGQKGLEITRYKGLGEMNAEQLWKTTMDPEQRTLKKVRLQDAIKADEMFSILMGAGVGPRKEFIERHALEVRNLDV